MHSICHGVLVTGHFKHFCGIFFLVNQHFCGIEFCGCVCWVGKKNKVVQLLSDGEVVGPPAVRHWSISSKGSRDATVRCAIIEE